MNVIEPSNYIPKPGDGKIPTIIKVVILATVVGIWWHRKNKSVKEEEERRKYH